MREAEFREWLIANHVVTTKKQVTDCVSRAKNVEKTFAKALNSAFDLDEEYKKDGLKGVRKALSANGTTHYMKEFIAPSTTINFPIGHPSMGALSNAILKYQQFCDTNTKD